MTTRAVVSSILGSVSVLVLGWQVGAPLIAAETATTATSAPLAGSEGTAGSGSAGATPVPPTAPATPDAPVTPVTPTAPAAPTVPVTPATPASGTFAGAVQSTRFGDVQVQITVTGGQITDVTALAVPSRDRKSVQISNRAVPLLNAEVQASQSANIAAISGATYTSRGYVASLQSALDTARR